MRSAYLDYAMSVIVGRALPDVRDGLKPVHRRVLFAMNEMGLQPNRRYVKCARIVGDGDGQVPPARRLGDLRHARPHGAGLLAARAAGRRPGQLRLGRRRSRRRHAVHGGPARRHRARDAARPRRRHRRLPAQLRRREHGADGPAVALPEPARQRLVRHRRRHGDEHPAAQPARGDRRHGRLHRRPGHRHRRPDAAPQGPGLPDRRRDPRPRPASARPTRPAAAASASAPAPTPSRCRTARRRSSSPSCPTR